MLKEFDPVAASNKEVLICYFQEDLRLSIQAKIDSCHREFNFWNKVLNKSIKTESKTALQSPTSIREMDACRWKSQRPNKKKKTSKSHKEKKTKLADSQLTTLAETQASGKNLQKTRGNCCDRRLSQATVDILATHVNLVNTICTNNSNDSQNRSQKDLS